MNFALSLPDPFRSIVTALELATSPKKTKRIEASAAAAIAYAKEEGDYEAMVDHTFVYLLARRKTTELIRPLIQHGGQGHQRVTLGQIGFTKMQWFRRMQELELSEDAIDAYFDECKSNGWLPSITGVVRHSLGTGTPNRTSPDVVHVCPNCGHIMR